MTDNAQDVIQSLFAKLMQSPRLFNNNDNLDENELAIIVSDYIAGMTDRYALQTFEKICK